MPRAAPKQTARAERIELRGGQAVPQVCRREVGRKRSPVLPSPNSPARSLHNPALVAPALNSVDNDQVGRLPTPRMNDLTLGQLHTGEIRPSGAFDFHVSLFAADHHA